MDLRPLTMFMALAGCSFSISVGGGVPDDDPAVDAAACSPTCPLGCDPTGARCLELVPSNGIDPAWLGEGTMAFAPTADVTIDTDQGRIDGATAGVYHQVDAVDCGNNKLVGIGVFSFTSITIPEGVIVRATGSRALALVASGAITIEGLIDLGAGAGCADPPRCAGAGGFMGGNYDAFAPQVGGGPGGGGAGYSNNGPGNESGGGGGGGCGGGGGGGDDGSGSFPPGAGGPSSLATVAALCGGSGGGAGGPASFASDPGARGGGGGGAVQLVSAVSVTVGSSTPSPSGITVAGAFGQGDKAQTIDDGGGGGGAGGMIVIEAPAITIGAGAVLAANGGGGGGGYNNGAISTDGMPGQLGANPAPGGSGVRRGGNGAAGVTLAGESAPGPVGDGGAGGGGGVGRIRLHSRTAAVTISGTVSPAIGTCTTEAAVTTR